MQVQTELTSRHELLRQLGDVLPDADKSLGIPPACYADDDLLALKEIDSRIKLGIGVVDIKVNHVESADEIASRIEKAEKEVGPGRISYIHPDCGFWMLKRSIADRKIAALTHGRDLYLGK